MQSTLARLNDDDHLPRNIVPYTDKSSPLEAFTTAKVLPILETKNAPGKVPSRYEGFSLRPDFTSHAYACAIHVENAPLPESLSIIARYLFHDSAN